ncbi:MAG: RNA 2',3'-cyclic phosphodiesterase [Candidatus Woesearchaeota archaeon]|nr:RNA 2',3'-cyclic phosphodiesterase [Candidatus Woesearchaeota archaeon]
MKIKHRIFIAINLPSDIKKQLNLYKDKWQELPAKWTNLGNMHITLEFLGNLTDEELGEVCMAVKEVSEKHKFFSINLNKIIYGPFQLHLGQAPKMIWAKGENSKELSFLKADLEDKLFKIVRLAPETKLFYPHVTLARIIGWEWKKIDPIERPEVNENIDFVFTVESIEVMESVFKKSGPEYTVIESHNLKV